MVAGVCLLSASSVTQHICNVTNQAAARGGQSCYVPLWRHLVITHFGHNVVVGEKYTSCRPRIVVPFGQTTQQYGMHVYVNRHFAAGSFQTPPDGRPPTPPHCTPPIDKPQ